MRTDPYTRRPWGRGLIFALAAAPALAGCNATDRLLKANNPDNIFPSSVTNAAGADGLRLGAISHLLAATAGAEGTWFLGGLLSDEWKSGDTFIERDETDKRTVNVSNFLNSDAFRESHRARVTADQAIAALRKFKPADTDDIAEMYFARGYAELTLAENYCNGAPIGSFNQDVLVYGVPESNDLTFARAAASADSALAIVAVSNTRVLFAARILKARALLDLGRYADAATAVQGVPTSYQYQETFRETSGPNWIWELNWNEARYVVGDSVDAAGRIGNAIPFASAGDPRAPVFASGRAFDSKTPFVGNLIWATDGPNQGDEDPVALVSGVDARLIEAEGALSTGNVGGWLTILNTLRAGPVQLSDGVTVTGMDPLSDPGSAAPRVDLQFREKAFWTFGRGERLGDLRRLIRQYGRTQDQVFPTGTFHKGGTYGTDVNLPIPQSEQNNPKALGCTDRKA